MTSGTWNGTVDVRDDAAAATMTASTANGQRRRNSSGDAGDSEHDRQGGRRPAGRRWRRRSRIGTPTTSGDQRVDRARRRVAHPSGRAGTRAERIPGPWHVIRSRVRVFHAPSPSAATHPRQRGDAPAAPTAMPIGARRGRCAPARPSACAAQRAPRNAIATISGCEGEDERQHDPDDGPARADERGQPDRHRGADRAGGEDVGVPATTIPACGSGAESARATSRPAITAIVTASSGSTIAHAPVTRAPNRASRERPVAARSRNTPDSMSCVPAVPPTIAPTTRAIWSSDVERVVVVLGAAGRAVLARGCSRAGCP